MVNIFRSLPVYCAGKISKNDWRHQLFPRIREVNQTFYLDGLDAPHCIPSLGPFVYCGPFFLSCDHGCAHGPNTHGLGADEAGFRHGVVCGKEPPSRDEVVQRCLRWLRNSSVVFAWIDDATAYGTVAEIGYAVALGKPVCLYEPNEGFRGEEHLWFARQMATTHATAPNAVTAFSRFTRSAVAQRLLNSDECSLP